MQFLRCVTRWTQPWMWELQMPDILRSTDCNQLKRVLCIVCPCNRTSGRLCTTFKSMRCQKSTNENAYILEGVRLSELMSDVICTSTLRELYVRHLDRHSELILRVDIPACMNPYIQISSGDSLVSLEWEYHQKLVLRLDEKPSYKWVINAVTWSSVLVSCTRSL